MPKKVKLDGKITVGVLVNSMDALNHLMPQRTIKAVASFRLNLLGDEIQKHLEAYNKAQRPIFEKYAKDDSVPVNKMDKYIKELQPVLDEEITLSIPDIRIKDLANAEISAIQLQQLNWLIDE